MTSLLRTCVLFLVAAMVAGCATGGKHSASGWTSLFNGSDLSGWVVKCRPKDRQTTFWTVENDVIAANSIGRKDHDYVWLVTEKEYGDFELTLRFQTYRNSPGNSGIQIRSRYDDDAGWLDGPQVDINPSGPWRTGMVWDETRGNQRWLWPTVPKGQWVKPEMARPGLKWKHSDEENGWNEMTVTARGTEICATVNGTSVLEWDGKGILDDETHRKRNVGLKGHIALQIHTGDELRIAFTDILIRELK